MQITDFKITKKEFKVDDYLAGIIKGIAEKAGNKEIENLIPARKWHEIEFTLKTYSGMANGIRRMLLEEIPVWCMDPDASSIETNDEFIITDLLSKRINLVPLDQDFVWESMKSSSGKSEDSKGKTEVPDKLVEDSKQIDIKFTLYLNNPTNESIDIMSEHIKGSGIPKGIVLSRLRPGKFIKITKINIVCGFCKDNAAKFSLLDDLRYDIKDMIPYDTQTKKGQRSIEHDPEVFHLSFKTAGNIEPSTLFRLLKQEAVRRLKLVKQKIETYDETYDPKQKYYTADNFTVSIENQMHTYKIKGEYITLAYMIGHRCYILDRNIGYCAATFERLDNEIAVIKLKHPEPNKVLIEAINECIADFGKLHEAFIKSK